MATEKEMNEAAFDKIASELDASAEIIRSRQDQKQVVINDFSKERKRYHQGKISEKALAASVPRIRKELQRLSKEIRKNINELGREASRTKSFAQHQSPKNFRVSVSGISSSKRTKKASHRTHKRKR
jgi:hypothetical protein